MKKFFSVGILASLATIVVGAGCLFLPKTVNAEEFTIDLFKSNGATIEAAHDSYSGLKISADKNGDGVLLRDSVAGRFVMEYAPLYGNTFCDINLIFQDIKTNDTVQLNLDCSEADINASLSHGDDTVGLYYGGRDVDSYNKGLQGRTKGANTSGYYTVVQNRDEHTVVFDPESYSFYLDDSLIWSFVLEDNDGASAKLLSGFEEYTVEISFDRIEGDNGGMIIKAINGTALNNYTYSNWSTSIVVLNNLYAYDGIPYIIPKPYVYNIAEGILNANKVDVMVFDESKQCIVSEKYSEKLSFIPNGENANYQIVYSYKADENTVKSTLNVSCYTEENVDTKYVFSSEIDSTELGLNAQLVLPRAKVQSQIFISDKSEDVFIDVYKDGEVYANYQELSAKEKNIISLNDLGTYTVRYYAACDYVVDDYTVDLKVSDDLLAYDYINIDDVLRVDTKLNIPQINFYYQGETYQATSKIIFPSGACYSNKLIVLDEIGVYTIRYTAVCGGVEYFVDKEVQVLYTSETAFSYDETLNTVGFGFAATTNKIQGVHVITKSNNAEVVYKEKIDLLKLDRNIPLVELFGDAKTLGEEAFTKFTIKLIDAYDASNIVTITCEAKLTEVNGSYIKAGATGQSLLGYWDAKPQLVSGFPSLFDFQGEINGGDISKATLSISMDYAERKLYSLNAYNTTVAAKTDYCITDLDDSNIYLTPWSGFTTGECYLSVSVAGMTSSTASYTIMTIAGKPVEEEFFTVKEPPIISLDLNGEPPVGCVGMGYSIFSAKATDYYMHNVAVEAKVYYAYGRLNQGEIRVNDNKFVPNMEGIYTIVYTAIDAFGNISTKQVDVEVKDVIPKIEVELEKDGQTSAHFGEKVAIKSVVSLHGGSGTIQQNIRVVAPSGENCELENGVFIPKEEGEYVIEYTFTDYLGQVVVKNYTISVAIAEQPILTETLVLPKYFVGETMYTLPNLIATSYVEGETIDVFPNIYITDSDGRHLLDGTAYLAKIVSDNEDILVEYVYRSSNGATTTLTETVKGIIVKEGNKISLDKYFVGNGVKFDKNDASVVVSTDKSNSGFEFINPLYAENLQLTFSIIPEQFNAETFKLTITDMYDIQKEVVFDFRFDVDEQKLYCSLNGGVEKLMSCTFIENASEISFMLVYDSFLNAWEDVTGMVFEQAKTYANGEEFEGFSKFVYFNVQFGQMSDVTILNIKQLNNQTFNNLTRDVIAPEIKVGELDTKVSLGDIVTIPSMEAYDVLGYIVSKKVTVQYSYNGQVKYIADENGITLNGVDALKEYRIKLEQYGEYIVSYVAEDNSGRTVTVIKNIAIPDNEKPQVTVSASYESVYCLNDVIVIQSMTAQDNLTAKENLKQVIYVIDANGEMHRLQAGDSYKFILYGKHVIRYFVVDEAGNIAMIDYIMTIELEESYEN